MSYPCHILSTSNDTLLKNFSRQPEIINFNTFEEEAIDERLLDTFLEISGRENSAPQSMSFSSAETISSTISEEEADSDSSSQRTSTIRAEDKPKKSVNTRKLHNKKMSLSDSDSDPDSLNEYSATRSEKLSCLTKSLYKKPTTAISQQQETSSTETDAKKQQKNLYKTELCRNWEETSRCRYGVKCQYAHGAADLRETNRHPKYKTQKCRTFHQTGACPYGSRCTFRHFNLPGDALEMKNLEDQEQQQDQQQFQTKQPSIFSPENKRLLLEQNWFLDTNLSNNSIMFDKSNSTMPKITGQQFSNNDTFFDHEDDSLLPSNAESLLPHQLLFNLESPEEEEQKPVTRCPLRNYVNLPSFSSFQVPHYHRQQQQQQQTQNSNAFFRPWLF